MWKMFRHLGRVHDNYLDALETGFVRFDPQAGRLSGPATRAAMTEEFGRLAARHAAVFEAVRADQTVNWFGETVSLETHLMRLISHESLHHGQFMMVWRQLGLSFPQSWAAWGEA